MKVNYNHFIIFSVYQAHLNDQLNELNHLIALGTLKHYDIKEIHGVYKGKQERSIMIQLPPFMSNEYLELVDYIKTRAKKYNQENILYVHNDRMAELIELNTQNRIKVGHFVEVTETEAKAKDCYSILDGKYYTTV